MKYLIGNWKANKTLKEASSWIEKVKNKKLVFNENLQLILCPSFIHLTLFKKEYPEIKLGCQDISPYGDGAYTGEITARMVSELVDYVILGHSERQKYFSESENIVALKAIQALDNQVTPIIAVNKNNWRTQFRSLNHSIISKSIIMYEPPEAISKQVGPIGTGEAAPIEEVKEIIRYIKKDGKAKLVIYGGSIKSDNIQEFLDEEIIDGVLPGSASLQAEEWILMIQKASQIISNKQ